MLGLLTGSIAGLATITPAAGYVTIQVAALIGVVSGVCGILGVVVLGIFATKAVNASGADGLLLGNSEFFIKQCVAVVGFASYAFVFSYAVLFVMQKFIPVKTSDAEEKTGLDMALHGEEAYI